jgi:hypothetical protein
MGVRPNAVIGLIARRLHDLVVTERVNRGKRPAVP